MATIPDTTTPNDLIHCCSDFWRYFEPVREGMPQNCSNDVQAAIVAFDAAIPDEKAFAAIQASFGLADVTHKDDVMGACASLTFILVV